MSFAPQALAQQTAALRAVRTNESLSAVRKSAGAWQATITTILGILGLGSIFGRSDVQALPHTAKTLVIIGLVVAVVTAVSALFFMSKAAAGIPKVILVSRQARRAELAKATNDQDDLEKAGDAAENLALSLILTAISVVVALGTVGILWAVGDAKDKVPHQVVFKNAGTTYTYCGVITDDRDGNGTVVPPVDGATPVHFTKAEVIAITAC